MLVLASLLAYANQANACIPTINWNDSINFCGGNSITLSAVNQNSTYLWSTGATTPTLTVSSSGTYWVKVTNPCGSANDTVHVSADSPLYLNLGVDRKVCQSTTLTVPQNSFSTYLWQDGSTASQMQVTQTGTYWVEVVNGCGTFEDTVQITVESQPNPSLGPDINDCTPTTHSFYVPTFTNASVLWSTGDTGTSISTANPGTYWVEMSNSCGTFTDSVTITLNQGQTLSIGDTINKCANGLAVLQANVTGGSYQWSTGASSKNIKCTIARQLLASIHGSLWYLLRHSIGGEFWQGAGKSGA
ncbi:MAG: hypothetical protein U5L96_00235 [Owenweeksia sp.]|nr:hypothetical protein [Owenweeksia sp.]